MAVPVVDVPWSVRIELLHGYLQAVAEEVGVDLLHLKGAAVHPSLSLTERASTDVDVLVRPAQVERLVDELLRLGWKRMLGFSEGSAFGHAMTMTHELGMIDIHRHWPGIGIDPETAFDLLWAHGESVVLAGRECAVPDVDGQRLVLLMHAGRSGGARPADIDACWTTADDAAKRRVEALADQLDARVALAAGIGDLERFRGHPQYSLWAHFAEGSTNRLDEWRGRWQAAPGLRPRLHVFFGAVSVNRDLLRVELDREPRAADFLPAFARRVATAVGEFTDAVRHRRRDDL